MSRMTLAFDVFGTLIDTSGIIPALEGMIGESAHSVSRIWRDKQLEYSFRRGLMHDYQDFGVCTRQALEYATLVCDTPLSDRQMQSLLESYLHLPSFPEVPEVLAELGSQGYRLFAFSNGTAAAVKTLLVNSGIDGYFQGMISVDEVRSFKPDPAVYRHFLEKTGAKPSATWLISGNAFDVIGAMRVGLNTAWVQRDPTLIFDPWGQKPSITIKNLWQLHTALQGTGNG